MFRILFTSVVVATFLLTSVHGEDFPECNNQPIGSFVAVLYNCSKAIYCDGVNSAIVDCDNDNPYFSPKDEMCHSTSNICGKRPFNGEQIITTTILSIPTATTRITTVANGIKPTINPATTLSSLTVPTSSTPSSITNAIFTTAHVTPNSSPPVLTTSITERPSNTDHSTSSLQCPVVDDPNKPLFLPHPKSCSQYYLCYHGVATLIQCPNMLHFDAAQQTCNLAERAKCQVSPVLPRELCLPHTVGVYPHSINCNYYYLCEYGFLMVMQCPFNMNWDYEKRTCAMKSRAKCYSGL